MDAFEKSVLFFSQTELKDAVYILTRNKLQNCIQLGSNDDTRG